MKTADITLLIFISTMGTLNAQLEGEWKLPILPIAITINTAGEIGIKGTTSIVTPIGQFSISSPSYKVSPSSSEQNNNKIIKERVIIEKPVYRDRIVYKEVKGEDKIIKIPVVKEVVKEVIVKEKEYLLVIRNRYLNNDMLFIIKGVDELEAEIKGHTCILAKEGQIIIDISDAAISQIKFRGKKIDYPKTEPDNYEKYTQRVNTKSNLVSDGQWRQNRVQIEERNRLPEESEIYKLERTKERDVRERVRCKYCNGDGFVECARCKGKGFIRCADCKGRGCKYCDYSGIWGDCLDCHGHGRFSCPHRHR